jgi:hypothetical protein
MSDYAFEDGKLLPKYSNLTPAVPPRLMMSTTIVIMVMGLMSMIATMKNFNQTLRHEGWHAELACYLTDIPDDVMKDTDIVLWWGMHLKIYPTLA